MADDLKKLLEESKRYKMTPDQREAQRRSFAYGNAKLENDLVTRESIDRQAQILASKGGQIHG